MGGLREARESARLRAGYRRACEAVEREFKRNRRLHGRRIQCGKGCTDCCHHIFHITEMEAADISAGVSSLPEKERAALRESAARSLPAQRAILRRCGYIQAWGNLPTPETRLACPALVDGACAIYAHRPMICRKYGMPLFYPERERRTFACELNFEPGEGIQDPEIVRIQPSIEAKWRELQQAYDRAGGRRYDMPITVAHAILEDFRELLP